MDASDDLNSFNDTYGCSNSCKLKVGFGEGKFYFEYFGLVSVVNVTISFNLESVLTMKVWTFYCLSVHETGDEVSNGEISENLDCAA